MKYDYRTLFYSRILFQFHQVSRSNLRYYFSAKRFHCPISVDLVARVFLSTVSVAIETSTRVLHTRVASPRGYRVPFSRSVGEL